MTVHELRHKSVQVCSCGALLYEDRTGIYCSATNDKLPWYETRHSKKCVRTDEGWECVKQCLVHRAELKLKASMREDRTPLIQQAILDVAVDGVVPFGTDMRISKEVGRSRERVRQVRKAMGIYRSRLVRYGCAECGRPLDERIQKRIRLGVWNGTPLCREHKRIPIACNSCGKLVMKLAAQYVWRLNSDGRYDGPQYCSRSCAAKDHGKRYGWGSPEHPIHHQVHEPKHGTVNEYSRYHCRCELCKGEMHKKYLLRKARHAMAEAE